MRNRLELGSSLVATLLACVLALLAGPSAEAAAACGSSALAHRGAWTARIDENTLKAIDRAHRLKEATENDVFLTRDGRFVIIHSKYLRYTTNCRGRVARWRLAAIQARCHTTPNRMRIPSASAAFRTLAGNARQRMNLEIKGPGWFDNDNAKLVALRNLAARAGVLRQVFFSNDATYRTLRALRHSAPSARTAFKPKRGRHLTIARASRLSVDAVMAKPRQWSSGQKVRRFKRADFQVWASLSDRKRIWRQNWRRGIEAQLTNRPGAYRKWCRRVG
jgi:glycerophosphoryl diester phosphodiesterase